MPESKGLYELSDEKEEDEGVLMDVDAAAATDWTSLQRPASSYDIDAVGTGAANVSLEQETEDDDDRLTTSTIEYYYSEEEIYYYSSGGEDEDPSENACEDDDDDDEEEDPIMNVDSDLEVLEVDQNDQGDIEELMTEEMENAVPTTDDESESDSDGEKPSKEDWIASWNKGDPQKHLTWINVYSYYRKNGEGYGGYGVIIRYGRAKPVIATAKYSKDGKSFFYQLLMGIKAGVKLSARHNLSGRYVICNSFKVGELIQHAHRCQTEKCRTSYSEKVICKDCKYYFDSCVGCDMGLWPLVQDLKHEGLDLVKYPRTSNEPAHYLAKMAKAKHDRNKLIGIDEDEDLGEIESDKFPSKLKDIVWKDFSVGMSIYRAASR